MAVLAASHQKSSDTVMYTISARTRDLSLAPVCLQVLLCTLKTPILIVQYTNRSLLTPANRHMSSPLPSSTIAAGICQHHSKCRGSRVRILDAMFHVITCNNVC